MPSKVPGEVYGDGGMAFVGGYPDGLWKDRNGYSGVDVETEIPSKFKRPIRNATATRVLPPDASSC